jgi:hypothetical protein
LTVNDPANGNRWHMLLADGEYRAMARLITTASRMSRRRFGAYLLEIARASTGRDPSPV